MNLTKSGMANVFYVDTTRTFGTVDRFNGVSEHLMKLYVGNLPANTSTKDLKDLFTPYGEVTFARVLTTRHGGHPRGFGYVEMLKQHAERAISELNGQRINFMVLRVSEAKS
jgi:RNA recognition motif-containing protein